MITRRASRPSWRLFRLLSGCRFKKTVRFVAFTLEEPPFFSTELMGSMVHAKNCRKRKDKIELMVCLEMMGFGSRRCHQDYPLNHNRMEYPVYGYYMSVISLPSNSMPVHEWTHVYNARARCKIYEYIGPASIPGMDLSDHMSFIRSGYPAIMISDTGFYRNKNYHSPDDTYETINFRFLCDSIDQFQRGVEAASRSGRIRLTGRSDTGFMIPSSSTCGVWGNMSNASTDSSR